MDHIGETYQVIYGTMQVKRGDLWYHLAKHFNGVHGCDVVPIDSESKKGSSESRLFVIERSERAKGELRAKVLSFDPPIIDLYISFAKHMSPLKL